MEKIRTFFNQEIIKGIKNGVVISALVVISVLTYFFTDRKKVSKRRR